MSWTDFNPKLDLTQPELLRLLARAQALAEVVRQVPLPPRAQEKFNRLNILRAVRGTTCIEGAELSETEVQAVVEAAVDQPVLPPSRHDEETEARNAYEVMQFIAQFVAQTVREGQANPASPAGRVGLTEELIREIHRRLTQNIAYPHNVPGEYRRIAVRVDRFRPPPPEQAPELMRRFVDWFSREPQSGWDRVVRAVVAHFYVVSIHPFADGNGRTARAVESFILYQGGINSRGFYSLANYYYRLRGEYFRQLDQARSTPDLTPLVLFAARGLVEELEGVCNEVLAQVRLIAFRDYARGLLARAKNLRATNRGRLQRFLLGVLEAQTQPRLQGSPTSPSSPTSPGAQGVSLAQLRAGEGLLAALYEGKSASTLTRDLKFLINHRLIVLDQGVIRANLALMNEFTS